MVESLGGVGVMWVIAAPLRHQTLVRTVRCKQCVAPRLGAWFPRKTAAGRVAPTGLAPYAPVRGQIKAGPGRL